MILSLSVTPLAPLSYTHTFSLPLSLPTSRAACSLLQFSAASVVEVAKVVEVEAVVEVAEAELLDKEDDHVLLG
jgi:hypothetical protein